MKTAPQSPERKEHSSRTCSSCCPLPTRSDGWGFYFKWSTVSMGRPGSTWVDLGRVGRPAIPYGALRQNGSLLIWKKFDAGREPTGIAKGLGWQKGLTEG